LTSPTSSLISAGLASPYNTFLTTSITDFVEVIETHHNYLSYNLDHYQKAKNAFFTLQTPYQARKS